MIRSNPQVATQQRRARAAGWGALLLGALLAVLVPGWAPDPVAAASPAWSTRGIPLQGQALFGSSSSNSSQDPTAREATFGGKLGVHRTYWAASQQNGAVNRATLDVAAGRLPWMSFTLPTAAGASTKLTWAQMAAGAGDAWAADLAKRLGAVPGPVWVAVNHEPENESGDLQDWKRMQQRLGPIFRAYPNIAFTVILMGYHQFMAPSPDPKKSMAALYPGSQYVDVVGFDPYNWYGTVKSSGVTVTAFDELKPYFDKFAAWAASVGGAKWAVSETGLTDVAAQRDVTWISRAYDDMKVAGGLALSYWDDTVDGKPSTTFRLDSALKQREYAKVLARSDRLADPGRGTTPTPTPTPTPTLTPTPTPAPAVATFRASATATGNDSRASLTLPTALRGGDTLLLFVSTNTGVAPTATAAGWVKSGERVVSSLRTELWTRAATSADAGGAVSVTLPSAAKFDLTLLAYAGASGATTVSALASAAETTSSAAHASPAVTVPDTSSLVLTYWVDKSSATTAWSLPGDQTRRAENAGSGSGRLTSVAADSGGVVAAGAWAPVVATASAASTKATMWTVALTAAG